MRHGRELPRYIAEGMTSCPRCGTDNPPELPACSACGLALSEGKPKRQNDLKKTVLGIGQSPGTPAAEKPSKLGETLIGLPSSVQMGGSLPTGHEQPSTSEARNPIQPAGPQALKGTLLGMPAAQPGQQAAPAGDPERAPTGKATVPLAGNFEQTRLGVAPNKTGHLGSPPEAVGDPPEKKTLLGVARPGIAPIHPAANKLPPPVQQQTGAAGAADAVTYEIPKRRLPRVAWVAILACLLMVFGLAGFWLLRSGSGPIRAKPVLDDSGKEHLELSCAGCEDGTKVSLEGSSTTFADGAAKLSLSRALSLGDNVLTLNLAEPGDGSKGEPISLTVPVLYRVRGDLSGLQKDPPKLIVNVEALQGTSVIVDGQALALDSKQQANYEIDVSDALQGPNSEVEQLQRTVPYSLTTTDGEKVSGKVQMQTGIAPLVVDAPGRSIVIDSAHFMLSGSTQAGGGVSVNGRAITVDAEGRFAQLMNVSSIGETTIFVRATAPERAPRSVPISIRRVESLTAEVKRRRPHSVVSYRDLLAGQKPLESLVLLTGNVVESRPQSHVTVLLLEVSSGCEHQPCLARVVHGARLSLKTDQDVTVSGWLLGEVAGPRSHSKIPEIHADFVLEGTH